MSDIYSILQSNYVAAGSNVNYSKGPYVAVDAASYEGNWTGKYANNDLSTSRSRTSSVFAPRSATRAAAR
jgi:hypothetical protein